MITWKGCNGELYSANAKCKACGKTCSGHISGECADTKRKHLAPVALGAAVKAAAAIFPASSKLRVVITRGASAIALDHDNLEGGCKALRDEIARHLLGRDDAERFGIEWEYEQAKTPFHKIEIYEVKNEK